ncbi:TPA: HNH endonuclease signature motif containing protein [Pseudomonas aeruginosa]|uniref:HNH endonuclease n=1 Tax=Pseudomonas TaxID=286 RepID=UPI001068956C|nr:HNH endonuclease [Pseudomonas aeruginosa]ELC8898603.1 HNH endonuclease [Pseudomonas aeruginosa]ELM5336025.1 HNH endonuclease [Pseudomonas aeruginosa]MBG6412521.1 HNH endonuclease [Pseudomonas aeruginosa]MBG6424886.1 HNH endonuclease [Pseudomonas aeruginosa]
MNPKRDSAHRRAISIAKTREEHKCELCSKDMNLHGHHIIDLGFGGNGEPENILVVCKSCHDKIHNGEIVINNYDYRGR